jgi:C terminal of Calcineurin-like phosphoesterase/Calcineurin-like phosphoesterase/N terminal of Calcineurin-like phosphoesterase
MNSATKAAGIGCLSVALAAVRLSAATGFVFDDQNGNGTHDAGEPGLESVAVSNGVDVVLTDGTGAFKIADRPGARIFVIKPRGWRPAVDASNSARFYSPPDSVSFDFPLVKADERDDMRALVLTDPQPESATEVDYLARVVAAGIGHRPDLAFGVTLGDVVYNRPDFFPAVSAAEEKIGIPMYSLPGNHDVNMGTPNEQAAIASFESALGPSTYAFHAGPALFIALDDVRPLGGPRFIGGLRDDQLEFVGNVLRYAKPGEWVVLMMHIPLFRMDAPYVADSFRQADRLRLFEMLKGRERILILSGHTHYQRHEVHGADDGWTGTAPIHEYNVAAACGGFWSGPLDASGIPAATMSDGTPPGYAIIGFEGDHVAMDYFPWRGPADHQMEIQSPDAVAPRQGYVSFYANVFNGHDGWTVEARVDDRAWKGIPRILGWDPTYAAEFLAQNSTAHPTATKRLTDPGLCYHLWRGILPADLPLGPHMLFVRATDPQGKVFSSQRPLDIVAP